MGQVEHEQALAMLTDAVSQHTAHAPITSSLTTLAQAVLVGCRAHRVVVTEAATGAELARVGEAPYESGPTDTTIPLTDAHGSRLGALTLVGEVQEGDRGLLDLCVVQMSTFLSDEADRRAGDLDRARQEAVWSVVRASAQHLDLDDVLHAAIDALRAGIRCQGVMIRAFASRDPASLRHYSAAFPPEAEDLMSGEILDISARAARVCWERQTVSSLHSDDRDIEPLTNTAERDFMFELMDLIGARGLLMAPLGGGGECQGYISLTRTTLDEPFDDSDEAAVLAIGRELGMAVVHARLFHDQRRLVGELQELDRYKSQFLATVAHQLKNPLTSVTGHAELLADFASNPRADPEQLGESVRVIQRGAGRILETADSLLTLSKLQDADHPFIPGIVAMTPLIAECLDMVSIAAHGQQVTITVDADAPDLFAWGDRSELEKLVDNLLGNAVKYSPPGGHVQLRLSRSGDALLLVCQDHGLGIAEADLLRLFEPFHRSTDPQALAIPGTGLGMAIVKRVVDRHDGRIEVTSTLGTGTRFEVTLPAAIDAA
jgi:signal transduction histidine kinase